MKNLTRRAAAALFAGAMLFGVAACGDDDVDTSEELEQDIEGTGEDLGGEIQEGGEELEEGGEELDE